MPCYAIVRQQLGPRVVEEPKPAPEASAGFMHSLHWSWGNKELVLHGTGRSKKAAKHAAARDLLKRLALEEQELMDPTKNGALAQWAMDWINQTLEASMELQEDELEQEQAEGAQADACTSHICTWSCPNLEEEIVVRVNARTAAKSRWQAMAALYQELPSSLEEFIMTKTAAAQQQKEQQHHQPDSHLLRSLEEDMLIKINSLHNTLVQRLAIRCQHTFSHMSSKKFKCTVQWTVVDTTVARTAEATGFGRSKALAKAEANAQVLETEGHMPRLTPEFRSSVAQLRWALNHSRFREAVTVAEELLKATTPGPAGWLLFLPEVMRSMLAEGDEAAISRLLDTTFQQLQEQGGAPLELWEALLDEASFALRHYRRAALMLDQLATFPLTEGSFPGPKEANYFRHFRHLLALERHGGLLHGIQQYELDPQAFCSVPTVDVHQLEGDKVVLTTPPGSAALDILEGPRPLRAGDLVLLVPMEVVGRELVTGSEPELGEGEMLPSNWDHPQAWLASITGLKGNPRSGDNLRLSTNRISRFGSDAAQPGSEEAVAPIALGRHYRLFFISMETPLARMLAALRCLCRARLPAWSDNFEGRKPSSSYTDELRRLLLGTPKEACTLAMDPTRGWPTDCSSEDMVGRLAAQRPWCAALTPSQRRAVQLALEQRLSLIQGPPGTGKTYVACAVIAAWVETYGLHGERILAVADSNVASDNLLSRLQAFGIESVRVGHGKEVETMAGDSLWKAIRAANVVIATCIGSGMEALNTKGNAGAFQRVVVDECTQACEPAALVALGRCCEQVVLIGDHAQLPATVLSKLALRKGLGVSLFERMVDSGVAPTVLLEQRRMHSSISEFPNRTFYASQLVNSVDDSSLATVAGFPWPNPECRVCFVDVVGEDEMEEAKRGFSTFNVTEATTVAKVVHEVLEAGLPPQDLCILTAYVAQRLEIIRILQDKGLRKYLPQLSVDTIDGYQGMERDLVLFSATRRNSRSDLGFLSDARRMNVMLTRARRGLIVFGHGMTLRGSRGTDCRWPSWLEWAEEKGASLHVTKLAAFYSGLASIDSPPSPPPPPPLQSQWQRVYSEQYGQHYYWDKATNRTQWETPPECAA